MSYVKFLGLVFLLFLLVACSEEAGSDDNSAAAAESSATPPVAEAVEEVAAEAEPSPTAEEPTPTIDVPTPFYIEAPAILATPDTSVEPIVLDLGLTGGGLDTLDPQRAISDNAVELIENLFVGLTRYNLVTNRVEGELAERWEISSDGLTWTFHLRTDIYWVQPIGGGAFDFIQPDEEIRLDEVQTVRQVVADDMVYAIQRVCDPATRAPDAFILFIIQGCESVNQQVEATAVDLDNIGVKARGPFAIEFTLTRPANQFLVITTLPLVRPVPRDLIANTAVGVDWAALDQLSFASGPFLISPQSAVDQQIILEKNPFWPYDRGGNVDLVNLFQLNDIATAFELWEDRNLDLSELPLSRQSDVLARSAQKARLVPEQAVFYLAYNFESPVFGQPTLRRAFSAAINREELIEQVYDEQGLPMRHFTPPGVFGAPPINEIGVGYNPDFAREQLLASSFPSCRTIPPIRFMISSSDTSLFQAELIREMWVEELGCEEEQFIIEQVPFGVLLANTRQDAGPVRPDIWELGWASYYPDAHNWLADVLHCAESDNRPNRPCSEVDELLRRATMAEPDIREQIFRRVERELFSGGGITPIVPLFVRAEYLMTQTWVESFAISSFGGRQFDLIRIDAELKRIEKEQ